MYAPKKAGSLVPWPPYRFLLAGLAVGAAAFVIGAADRIFYRYGLDIGEGLLLDMARDFARGECPYRAPGGYPYKAAHYPPVFPLFASLGLLAWGESFAFGRLISAVSAVLVAFLLGTLVRRESGSRLGALVTGLLFLSSPWVASWSTLYRPDLLALGGTAAGLVVAQRGWGDRGIYLSIPLFLLAGLTKQSFVAAPAAVLLALAREDPARAWRWGAAALAAAAGALAVLCAATGGHALFHLFGSIPWQFSGAALRNGLYSALQVHPGLLALGAIGFLARPKGCGGKLLDAYFLLAGLGCLNAGYVGSSVNYFLEVLAAASVFAGLAFARFEEAAELRAGGRVAAWVLASLQLVAGFHPPARTPYRLSPPHAERIARRVREAPGPVITEDPAWAVVEGKPLVYSAWAMSRLARKGAWDERPFVEDLRRGRFRLIVLNGDVEGSYAGGGDAFTPAMSAAVREAYRLAERIEFVHLYVPK